MRLLRNGFIGAALALVFLIAGSGTAGAHTSEGSTVAGAAGGWLDHAGALGDGVYSYALADTNPSDGRCAILQLTWTGQAWYTQASACGNTASGTFEAPGGGVAFKVCAFGIGTTQCGPTRLYWDNNS